MSSGGGAYFCFSRRKGFSCMGAIGVWIMEHARVITAWTARLLGWSALVGVFVALGVYNTFGTLLVSTADSLHRVAVLIPTAVNTYNTAISDVSQQYDVVNFILWLFNVSSLSKMLGFLVADVGVLFTAFITTMATCASIISATWVYRQAQAFTGVLAGGKLSGSNQVD